MPAIKTIRAIERAMQVLRYLQSHAPASLEDVHQGTGLARATAARVLLTLQNEGMVRRGLADQLYRNSARLPQLSGDVKMRDRLAEAAAPHLARLCRAIGWPSDVMVRRGLYMEIAESTRTLSPFLVQRMQMNEMVTLPATAVGRVYLAFCDETERAEIAAELDRIGFSLEGFYGGTARFRRALEEIRAAGYADRHPSQRGQTSLTNADYDDGLAAIAVPLISKPLSLEGRGQGEGGKNKDAAQPHGHGKVWGAMNLLWNRDAATVAEITAQYLPRLQETAAAIMEGVE